MFGVIKTERAFPEVLAEIQKYIAENCSALLSVTDMSERKEELKNYIEKALEVKKLSCTGMSHNTLVETLYKEMAEYSFLTNYLYNKEVEEININRWNDIKVNYSDGSMRRIPEKFRSPDHALEVMKKLLRVSGMILDASQPIVRGHLRGNIRITAFCPPVIDLEAGVIASIRLVNPKQLGKEELVEKGTLTNEMYDFLVMCCRAKQSISFAGEPGSGKTTMMGAVLKDFLDIMPEFRMATIEKETRELNLVREENGVFVNNIFHLTTRKSNDEKLNITQETLLEACLTSGVVGIAMAEMKSGEAYEAQEAARAGMLVLTTTHSNSAYETYARMCTLCRLSKNIEYEILYDLVTTAYPISVHARKIAGTDKRRITEIGEMTMIDGKKVFRSLWKYDVKTDAYIKVQSISDGLKERLRGNDIPENEIARY